jgi:ubiquinol-cytochrome c reductase subunit 7
MRPPTGNSASSTCPSRPVSPHRKPNKYPSADDLISEENEDVQLALKRLPPKQSYDRVFRIRRATQLSLQQKILPRDQWTKPDEDKPYLGHLVSVLEAEAKEREDLDAVTVLRTH